MRSVSHAPYKVTKHGFINELLFPEQEGEKNQKIFFLSCRTQFPKIKLDTSFLISSIIRVTDFPTVLKNNIHKNRRGSNV